MARRSRKPVPDPHLEATQVLDAHAMDRTLILAPDAMEHTQILDAHAMDRTQVMDFRAAEGAPEERPGDMEGTQVLDPQAAETTQVLPPPGPTAPILLDAPVSKPAFETTSLEDRGPWQRLPWKAVGVGAAVFVLALGAWALVDGGRPSEVSARAAAKVAVPADIEALLAKAQAGDAHAMRTVATRYTYGLGVPADREEGLRWYRKAAEAGSRVAREELKALEGR